MTLHPQIVELIIIERIQPSLIRLLICLDIPAGNLLRIRKVMRVSTVLAVGFGILLGYISIALGPYIFRIYSGDPEVIAYASRKLLIINSMYFLSGIQDVYSGGIKGFGRSTVAMVNGIVGVCLTRLIYIWTVFAHWPTFDVLFAVYPVSFAVTALLMCVTFYILYRRILREEGTKPARP